MIEIIRAGLCDLVMDQGRPGWCALGVPAGGAADPAALAAGNRLVGNDPAAAEIEIVLSGPSLRFPEGAVLALTGARFDASTASGAPVRWNETLVLAPGETLTLGQAETGCRCWLSLRGGLDVPPVMGSCSTLLPAGFGGHHGRALRAGDVLSCHHASGHPSRLRARPPLNVDEETPLRVVAGPQSALFSDEELAAFFGGRFHVGSGCDRRGMRLRGAMPTHELSGLPSQGVLPGAIQVPPDGQPIILGWDGPVTGGYPILAGVVAADWPRLAQLRPGDTVRFETLDIETAHTLAASTWQIEEST
ncbi:MAG: biotin-dependent carboxyltransferase family protein [Thiobacillus sp.]